MTTHELAAVLLAQPDVLVRVPSNWAYDEKDQRSYNQPYLPVVSVKTKHNNCYLAPDDHDKNPNETLP